MIIISAVEKLFSMDYLQIIIKKMQGKGSWISNFILILGSVLTLEKWYSKVAMICTASSAISGFLCSKWSSKPL